MKLTRAEEQALRLAVALARRGAQVGLAELAERENLSAPLVAKVLGKLREAGLVRAVRGRRGGYELAASPEEVTVASVFRAVSPGSLVQGCFNDERQPSRPDCPHESDCGLRAVLGYLEGRVTRGLEGVTLADLCEGEAATRRTLVHLESDHRGLSSGA